MSKLKDSILTELFRGCDWREVVQKMRDLKIGWEDLLEYWEEDESWYDTYESIEHFDKRFWGKLAEKLEESKHEQL